MKRDRRVMTGAVGLVALLAVVGCTPPTGGSTDNGGSGRDPFQGQWTFIDGGTETGLAPAGGVRDPRPVVASAAGELYAAWKAYVDSGPSSSQVVRVSRYDGDGSTSVWTAVDDGGVSVSEGVASRDAIDLEPFGGRLYLAWIEDDTDLRVAAYDPATPADGWQLVDDGGLNSVAGDDASQLDLAVADGRLYAVWVERETGGPGTSNVFVAEYNGNDASPAWTEVGTQIEYGISSAPQDPHAIGFDGSLVVVWAEGTDIRAKTYDPVADAWSSADGDAALNYDAANFAADPALARLGNELYLFWREDDSSGNGQLRARVYDGTDWAFVDGGAETSDLNGNPGGEGVRVQPAPLTFDGTLYVGFGEKDSQDIDRLRVAAFNGNSSDPQWSFVDGGQSTGLNSDADYGVERAVAIAHEGTVVVTWMQFVGAAAEVFGVRVIQGR